MHQILYKGEITMEEARFEKGELLVINFNEKVSSSRMDYSNILFICAGEIPHKQYDPDCSTDPDCPDTVEYIWDPNTFNVFNGTKNNYGEHMFCTAKEFISEYRYLRYLYENDKGFKDYIDLIASESDIDYFDKSLEFSIMQMINKTINSIKTWINMIQNHYTMISPRVLKLYYVSDNVKYLKFKKAIEEADLPFDPLMSLIRHLFGSSKILE